MSLSPYFRSPFTDLTPYFFTHQWYGRCADFEMKLINCLEAYGLDKGRLKCTNYINDFQECHLRIMQRERSDVMRAERERQYQSGERSKENRYQKVPPEADSW